MRMVAPFTFGAAVRIEGGMDPTPLLDRHCCCGPNSYGMFLVYNCTHVFSGDYLELLYSKAGHFPQYIVVLSPPCLILRRDQAGSTCSRAR